jgi:hypothetical protein
MARVNTHPPSAWLDNPERKFIDRRFVGTGLFKAQLAEAPHLPMVYSHPGSSLSSESASRCHAIKALFKTFQAPVPVTKSGTTKNWMGRIAP